ncbi:WD40 repeat domain-containing protein [Microtetraspora glauca]|uniref:WD40 repeat domain-containing protein n=1 Tax=Microtetraspora glauca TaxID=1996 RepID=A0ABV3GIP9_MICGL
MSVRRLSSVLAALLLIGSVPLASAGPTTVRWPRVPTACQETSRGGVPASFGSPVAMDMGGHANVTSVAVGELDGRPVAVSAGVERTIRVWDRATLKPIGDPIPGNGPVAYGSVNGRSVILGQGHRSLRMWDATTHRLIGGPLPTGRIVSIAFGEFDGRPIAATAGIDGAHVFDLATGREFGPPIIGGSGFSAVALTRVGGVLVVLTGTTDNVTVWNPVSGKPVGKPLVLEDEFVQTIRTIKTTVIGGRPVALIPTPDLGVISWDLITRQATPHSMKGTFDAPSLARLNGRTVFVSAERIEGAATDTRGSRLKSAIAVIDPATGERLSSFEIPGHVTSLTAGDLGGRPVIVTGGRDNAVRAYDLATGRELAPPAAGGPNGFVYALGADLYGRRVLVAWGTDDDGTLGVWDLGGGKPLGAPAKLPGRITSFTVGTYRGRVVLVAGIGIGDPSIRMFDIAARTPIGEPLVGYDHFASGVAITEVDRRVLVVGAGDGFAGPVVVPPGAVRVWDFASGTLLHDLTVRKGPAGQLALIRLAGRPVAVTFSADRARLWDVGTGKRMASFRIAKSEHSAPVEIARFDCTTVALVATGRTVELYDLTTGEQIERPLLGHSKQVGNIASGRVGGVPIAVTYSLQDKSMRVWDLTTSRQVGTLERPPGLLGSLSIEYLGGRAVLVGGGDEALWTWDLGPAA